MKKLFLIVLVIHLLGCSQNAQSPKLEFVELLTDSIEHKKKDPIASTIFKDTIGNKQVLNLCSCNGKTPKMSHKPDLRFSGYRFHVDSLDKWNSAERLKIKHLSFNKFDTIPSEFSLFKNVEFITIGPIDWKPIEGLDIFPKLKGIHFRGKEINLTKNPKWLKKIEVIHAEKSKIIGLKSFKSLPKLKKIKLAFSGFDSFPSDFDNLKCLNYFQTGAHTHGEIDLTQIDLSEMPCLKFVEFHSWHKNLKGLPLGLNHTKSIKIHHDNLSKKEKQQLKELTKKR